MSSASAKRSMPPETDEPHESAESVDGDAAPDDGEPELRYGWIVSVLFWLTLLTAAGLYSLVALAPRVEANIELKRQERQNHLQLLHVERQVKYLGQVVEALENDPEFARELARVEFDAGRPGYERLPVDSHLSLDARPARQQLTPDLDQPPWYVPVLMAFAQKGTARQNSITFAAVLVLIAFTFLHESQARQLWGLICHVRGGMRNFFARYTVPPPEEEEDDDEEEWEEVLLRRRRLPKTGSRV